MERTFKDFLLSIDAVIDHGKNIHTIVTSGGNRRSLLVGVIWPLYRVWGVFSNSFSCNSYIQRTSSILDNRTG